MDKIRVNLLFEINLFMFCELGYMIRLIENFFLFFFKFNKKGINFLSYFNRL